MDDSGVTLHYDMRKMTLFLELGTYHFEELTRA